MLDAAPTPLPGRGGTARADLGPRPIRFEGVTVTYPGRADPALDDVCLDRVRPGEHGRPSSARAAPARARCSRCCSASSLRTAGRVLGAATSASSTSTSSGWRRAARLGAAAPHLFAGTIADNIRLGDPRPSDGGGWSRRGAAGLADDARRGAGRPRYARSASAGCCCRPVSASASRWPGRCCATHRWCCSTSRRAPRRATPRPTSRVDSRGLAGPHGHRRHAPAGVGRGAERVGTSAMDGSNATTAGWRRRWRRLRHWPELWRYGMTVRRSILEYRQSPIRRLLKLARPLRATLLLAVVAGILTVGCSVALLGVSGFLIARASEHPNEVALALAVVGGAGFRRRPRVLPVRRAARDARRCLPGAGRPSRRHLPAPRTHRPARPRTAARRRFADPAGFRCRRGPGRLHPRSNAAARGRRGRSRCRPRGDDHLRPAGAALAAGLLVAGLAIPAVAALLARQADERLAPARGALNVEAADLIGGSAELLAYGADERALNAFADADRTVTRLARRSAVGTGLGAGLTQLVIGATVWMMLVLAVAAQHGGRLSRVSLAAVLLTGLASFEATGPLGAAAQQLVAAREQRPAHLRRARPAGPGHRAAVPAAHPDRARPSARLAGPHALLRRRAAGARRGRPRPAAGSPDRSRRPLAGRARARSSPRCCAFATWTSGEITLNGIPLDQLDSDDVRRVIGGCLADAHIFDSTIRENLRLARPAATRRRARRRRRPGAAPGVDSVAARSGGTPSSARTVPPCPGRSGSDSRWPARCWPHRPCWCWTSRPRIWTRRPATRSTADLLGVTRGRTPLLVTHDLDGLAGVDEIVVLDRGRVVQRGTHAELMAVDGVYRRMAEATSASTA